VKEWPRERFEDFRSEMWLAVHEGGFLFEIPGGSVDHVPEGLVRHGPWSPEDCSQVLLTWFDHGWIALFVPPEQEFRWASSGVVLTPDPSDPSWQLLEPDKARSILAEPETWTNERPEGFVCLGTTEHAPSSEFRDLWLDAIDPPG
jgi:hypothetical protein